MTVAFQSCAQTVNTFHGMIRTETTNPSHSRNSGSAARHTSHPAAVGRHRIRIFAGSSASCSSSDADHRRDEHPHGNLFGSLLGTRFRTFRRGANTTTTVFGAMRVMMVVIARREALVGGGGTALGQSFVVVVAVVVACDNTLHPVDIMMGHFGRNGCVR